MPEEERRSEIDNRSRLDRIADAYERWGVRTLTILGMLVAIQIGFGVLSVVLLGKNRQLTNDVRRIAERANDKADTARVLNALQREKVCSLSNERDACQALFERLSRNISDAQRLRLACTVLDQLEGPEARRIKARTPCPKQ